MAKESKMNREGFLKGAIVSIVTLIGAALGLPALPYLAGPALQKSGDQEWIRLGPTSKVELGQPTLFKFKVKTQSGWIVDEQELSAYVLSNDGREFVALSNVCTHLGCRVRWIDDEKTFFCPCHNAVFDKDGKVAAGPPPRPLDKFEIKVQDNTLYIKGG